MRERVSDGVSGRLSDRFWRRLLPLISWWAVVPLLSVGCGGSGGTPGVGGSTGVGGVSDAGGSPGSGGGAGGVAGAIGSGGAVGTGGVAGSDGSASGGQTGTGGAVGGTGGMFSGPSYPYILSCFNDDNSVPSTLMIYTSNDALNFTLLYDTGYAGPSGFMRDPSIMRHTDGKYYVAFTTPPDLSCCGAEQSFAIGSSSNLKDWTTIAVVPCGLAGVTNTWSPEWFVDSDGSVHLTVTLDLKTYRYEPTDATLTKWGPPKSIGINTIDTQIIKVGSTYHAIVQNRHGTASSLDGPWAFNNYACQTARRALPSSTSLGTPGAITAMTGAMVTRSPVSARTCSRRGHRSRHCPSSATRSVRAR